MFKKIDQQTLKSWGWTAAIILGMFVIVYIYLTPQFQGQTLKQHDIEQYSGGAREAKYFEKETGEIQLWTNGLFGGMPTTQLSMKHPGNFLGRTVMNFINKFPSPGGIVFLYMLNFFIMLRCFRVNKLLAFLGAVVFAFSSYEIIILQAGHNSKALAVAFMGPILGFAYQAYQTRKWLMVGLAGLFMAFELACNHLQVTYYFAFVLIALGITEIIKAYKNKAWKGFVQVSAGLIVVFGIAALTNYSNIKLTLDYAEETVRGGNDVEIDASGNPIEKAESSGLDLDYITQWSYGVGESFTLLSPYVKGGGSIVLAQGPYEDILDEFEFNRQERESLARYPAYWGDQPFTSGPVYIGVVVFLLMIVGLVLRPSPFAIAMVVVSALALALSWGKNKMGLTEWFVEYVPGYGKFRTVTIILVLIELIVPLLGVLFLQKLINEKEQFVSEKKKVMIAGGAFVVFLIFIKVVGIDGYTNDFDQKQLANIENQILGQLSNEDPAALKANYGLDINNGQQVQEFVGQQMQNYEDNLTNVKTVRERIFNKSMNRSIGFSLVALLVVLAFLQYTFSANILIGALGLLMIIDVVGVATNYLSKDEKLWVDKLSRIYPFAPNPADLQIADMEKNSNPKLVAAWDEGKKKGEALASEEEAVGSMKSRIVSAEQFSALGANSHYRIFDFNGAFNNSRPSYFHKSLGGYHGAKLRSIQNLFDFHLSKSNMEVYNMLNVKYLVQNGQNGPQAQINGGALGNAWVVQDLVEAKDETEAILKLNREVYYENVGGGQILKNDSPVAEVLDYGLCRLSYAANGDTFDIDLSNQVRESDSAYFVKDVNGRVNFVPAFVWAQDSAQQSFEALVKCVVTQKFNPKEAAIVYSSDLNELKGKKLDGRGAVELKSYQPMQMEYQSNLTADAFVVFSEMDYPDWTLEINGEPVKLYSVNYCLRGAVIPGGENQLVMKFNKKPFKTANTISFVGCLLVLLGVGAAWWFDRKKKEAQ